jgi:DNA primase
MAKAVKETLEFDGVEVALSNPEKIYFPKAGITKREVVDYYLAVLPGVLKALARRPMIMKRYVNGAESEPFYQKRAPPKRPAWLDIATFKFP